MPRILIFIVVGFILLAGGAIAIMQQMELGPFEPSAEEAAALLEKEKEAEPEPLVAPRFVNMNSLIIPIIQADKVYGTIQLQLQIETTLDREPKLKEVLPKLRDIFLRDLHAYLPRLLRRKKALDVTLIKYRLEVIGRRAFGKDIFEAVLIQSAVDRPIR